MFFDYSIKIIITLFIFIINIAAVIGFGSIIEFPFKFSKNKINDNYRLTIYGFSGYIIIYFICSIINFFRPLNFYISIPIILTGFLFFIINRKKIFIPIKKINISLIFLIIFVFAIVFRWSYYADTGLYHIQLVKWINESSLPLGLANLHGRFGFNSSWFIVASIFEMPFLLFRLPFFITNAIFIFLYGLPFLFILKNFSIFKLKLSSLFYLTTIIPWLNTKFTSIADSLSPDLPIRFIIFFVTFLIILILEDNKKNEGIIFFMLLFSFFSLTIKLSAFPIILMSLLLITYLSFKKQINYLKKHIIKIILCILLIITPWIIWGIFLSGYLAYPITFTRIPFLKWATPEIIAESDQNDIIWFGRNPKMPREEVLNSWTWVKPWFQNILNWNKILIVLIIIAIILLLMIIFKKNKYKINLNTFIFPVLANIVGVIFWFFTAPDFRFGYGYNYSIVLLILCFAIIKGNYFNYFYVLYNKFKILKKINKVYYLSLFFSVLIISASLIFIFNKQANIPVLKIISLVKSKEIDYLWLNKLSIFYLIILLMGLVLLFITIYNRIKKKISIFILSTILLSIVFTSITNISYLLYHKYYHNLPISLNIPYPEIIVKKTNENIKIYTTDGSGWDASLPSTPIAYFKEDLKIKYDKNNRIMFYFENN